MSRRHGRGQVLPAVFPVERVRMSGERAPECHQRKKAFSVVQFIGRCVVSSWQLFLLLNLVLCSITCSQQGHSRCPEGVMVSTLDSESSDLSSNLSGTSAAFGTQTPFLTVLSSQENSAFLGALLHSFASVFLLASPPPLCYPPALCSTLPTPPRPCLLLTEPWHPLE